MLDINNLDYLKYVFFKKSEIIESWFENKWNTKHIPIFSSIDIRNSGFKLSPIDVNLFPSGFNNLHNNVLPLCIHAIKSFMENVFPNCKNILILPENHTRNLFYLENLHVIKYILSNAGFIVRIGNLDTSTNKVKKIITKKNNLVYIEPIELMSNKIKLVDFNPCMLLLNNDLSSGIPKILMKLQQIVVPPIKLGWFYRLKSNYFNFFDIIVNEFSNKIGIDPWFINPYHTFVDNIDFLQNIGLDNIIEKSDFLLNCIKKKYKLYGINKKPFLVIKSDNGTYGMGVMTIQEVNELKTLNRKQRKNMSVSKGRRIINRVLLQEGIYTIESYKDGSTAESVMYMIGKFLIGGFYRIHKYKNENENLNSPGMNFIPINIFKNTNIIDNLKFFNVSKNFYIHSIIARLAVLAIVKEIEEVQDK